MVTVAGSSYGLNHLMNVRVGTRGRREGLPGGGSSTWTFGRRRSAVGSSAQRRKTSARLGVASGSPGKALGCLVTSRGGSGCGGSGGGGRWREISPERSSRAEMAVAAGFLGSRRGWDGTEGVVAVRCEREGVESVVRVLAWSRPGEGVAGLGRGGGAARGKRNRRPMD